MNTAITEKHTLITAADWFGGGRRVPYNLGYRRILTAPDDVNDLSTPHLMVFERVVGAPDATGRWITMLPGYPDGSYGYARVNALLADDLAPRLYVEYVGQATRISPRIIITRRWSAPIWWKRSGRRMAYGTPS